MDIPTLQKQNPWWENPQRIEEDIKLKELEKFDVIWAPRILKHIDFEKNAVYSIRGPRQIGKTTTIKLIIRNLLKTKNPSNIFYFACDNLKDNIQLQDLLETYYGWARNQNKERIYIFLDEISYVEEWQRAIKHFIDTKGSNNITMTLTGSHILDLKQSTERLPGRVGEKEGILSNKILLPMKFAEFVELINPEIYEQVKKWKLDRQESRNADFTQIINGTLPKSAWDLSRIILALDRLLDEYLITGGIMLAINDYHKTGKISPQIYEMYVKQILGDITRAGREEKTAKSILGSILKKTGNPISWNGIRSENDIASTPTVEQYAYVLRDLFVLNICYKIEMDGKQNPAGNKKIYIQNPFIFNALYAALFDSTSDPYLIAQGNILSSEKKSVLIESLVYNHLSRAFYNMRPIDIYDPADIIFYAKTNKGYEVDFVFKTQDLFAGVEVKYQNTLNPEDFRGLNKLGKGCMVSKKDFIQKEEFAVIPVSLFLLYI